MLDPAALGPAILKGITFVFMLVGLVGTLIPIFPGIPIIWLAALFYAIFSNMAGTMTGWDWFLFVLITILAIFGTVVDNIILASKLRDHGAPWRSIILTGLGAIVISLFFTPLVGLLTSPLVLFGVEYLRLRERNLAWASTKALLVGFSWAIAALFAVGSVMIGLWLLWALI